MRAAFGVASLAAAAFAVALFPYSQGPPLAHTGGFGEPTCHLCHFDAPLNPTEGSTDLAGLPAGYEPGHTYPLTLRLERPGMRSAGFQLAARFAEGRLAGRQAGSLRPTDDRIEVVTAEPSGIDYARQSGVGSTLETAGRTAWRLDWTAPAAAGGPIVFHVAANAANGDDSPFGDAIYQDSVRISHRAPPKNQLITEYRGLSAVDARVIWAAGRGGIYARSTDGGASWTLDSVPGASELFFVDVYGVDEYTAYLLGTHFEGGLGRIYKTLDGGASWALQFSDSTPGVFFDGLAFWDPARGIAFSDPVGGSFLIIITSNGGATWERVPPERIPLPLAGEAGFAASGTAISVHGSQHVWFGTGGGRVARVYRSTDGGWSWAVSETPLAAGASAGIFGLTFWDENNGVAVGGNYRRPHEATANVIRTRDGGRTWQLIGSSAPAGVRYGIAHHRAAATSSAADDPLLLAVGPSGLGVSRDAGAKWTVVDSTGYNTITTAAGRVWLAGVEGRIAGFDIGGL